MTSTDNSARIAILGIFVADVAFLAPRLPKIGETIAGSGFAMGPGGKGSNRAPQSDVDPTGAAFIYVNDQTGENAVIVYPGAAATLSPADVDEAAAVIEAARVFVTQLEQPVAAAQRGLEIARRAGVATIFNPAPAEPVPEAIYGLCDYIVPNETEAAALTGLPVDTIDDARRVGDALLARGVGTALITLGGRGALFHNRDRSIHLPALSAGTVIDTTGAGDAFVGGFAAALARGDADPRRG
jgi:ribokinase